MPSIPVDTTTLTLLEEVSTGGNSVQLTTTSDILQTALISCAIDATHTEHTSESMNYSGSNVTTHTLISTLKEEVSACSNAVPTFLLGSTTPSDSMSLSMRIDVLQLRFMAIKPRYRMRATELQSFFTFQSGKLQQERQEVISQSSPLFYININQSFDINHHKLIDRVEKSLSLLETKSVPVKQAVKSSFSRFLPDVRNSCSSLSALCNAKDSVPQDVYQFCASKRKVLKPKLLSNLNSTATTIMKTWYDSNKDYPYPSRDMCERMAGSGNITTDQVRKWFANKRSRDRNTRSQEDIMMEKHMRNKRKSDEFHDISNEEKRLRYE